MTGGLDDKKKLTFETKKKKNVHAHQKLENAALLTEFLHCLYFLMVRESEYSGACMNSEHTPA